MVSCSTHRGFSLIELLVALSILAIVAAILVPKFLGVRENAKATAVQSSLDEFNHEVSMWQSLGGQRAASQGVDNPYEAFRLAQFLATQSDGTSPTRNWPTDGTYPTDSMGTGGSWTISTSATVAASTSTRPSSTSDANGYYALPNIAGTSATGSDIKLYVKFDNQVYDLDAKDGDISTMIFIRTGNAPGVLP
jgi:prepilin-type N-terminal cleavage/methylation domain-containing protein